MDNTKSNAVRHIIATVFSAQNALRELAPEYKWAGMGNLLGDYGEFVCMEHYSLTKAPAGADGYDASQQVKRCRSRPTMRLQALGLGGS